jgi:hypothetical protein
MVVELAENVFVPFCLTFNRVKIIIFTSPNDARVTRGEAVIAGHLPPVGSRLPDLAEIELRG